MTNLQSSASTGSQYWYYRVQLYCNVYIRMLYKWIFSYTIHDLYEKVKMTALYKDNVNYSSETQHPYFLVFRPMRKRICTIIMYYCTWLTIVSSLIDRCKVIMKVFQTLWFASSPSVPSESVHVMKSKVSDWRSGNDTRVRRVLRDMANTQTYRVVICAEEWNDMLIISTFKSFC